MLGATMLMKADPIPPVRVDREPAGDPSAPLALVIGSGFGGLAAALRLRDRGYRVQVLEKLDAPGGRASVHRQDGFTFDAGPTIVTAPQLFEELWALAGRRLADDVTLRELHPFYRIRFADGSWFDYSRDPAAMRAEIERFSPADVAGVERLMAEGESCCRLGYDELGAKAFDSLRDLVAALPSLLRMRAWRSLYSLVARHVRHPKLRMVFSFHPLLIGGDPFEVTAVYSLIIALEKRWGVHYAMGGTGALVQGLVGLLARQGVGLRCGAEVARIEVDDAGGRPRARGVRLADGSRIAADLVVSNGDVAWTYKHLIEPRWRRHWSDRRIDRSAYSMSLFVWYFGTDRQWPDVPHHMILLGPRYRELLVDIFRRHRLADDFSMYLHRPTATDAAMAPPGCDAFYVLAPVPHLASGTDWARQAEPFRQRLQAALEASVLPGLSHHVVTSRVMTPQDFQDRLLSLHGAAFGLEPRLLQSAWFRPHNRSEDIERLYLVGAGTHPGAGLPGVLSSAKALASVIPDPATLRSGGGGGGGGSRRSGGSG
jgi:phytoene desaturase